MDRDDPAKDACVMVSMVGRRPDCAVDACEERPGAERPGAMDVCDDSPGMSMELLLTSGRRRYHSSVSLISSMMCLWIVCATLGTFMKITCSVRTRVLLVYPFIGRGKIHTHARAHMKGQDVGVSE